jgi:hypothetical protein
MVAVPTTPTARLREVANENIPGGIRTRAVPSTSCALRSIHARLRTPDRRPRARAHGHSCSPGVSADFDRALALLHNFWYARALEAFTEVAQRDPDCAIAYWGAAKTYDHPFWDPPTRSDESAAWALVQQGLRAPRKSPRERMYLAAVAALYKDGGAGPSRRGTSLRGGWRPRTRPRRRDETVLWASAGNGQGRQ